MFSKKMALLIGAIIIIAINFIVLAISSKDGLPGDGVQRLTLSLFAPFQQAFSKSAGFAEDIWSVYFSMVSAARENPGLKKQLALSESLQNRCTELELENQRLRKFIDFQSSQSDILIAAKVIGRDPSPWFKTIMIDKGKEQGLKKGLPVMVSEGVVGQIVMVADRYSKVLLVTDRNSAVDALVQETRARGIVKGNNTEHCFFTYALRKDEIQTGQMIISSGFDGVFSKGLRIGVVVDVKKDDSQLFQTILIKTCVDFDKLEEVLVSRKQYDSGDDA